MGDACRPHQVRSAGLLVLLLSFLAFFSGWDDCASRAYENTRCVGGENDTVLFAGRDGILCEGVRICGNDARCSCHYNVLDETYCESLEEGSRGPWYEECPLYAGLLIASVSIAGLLFVAGWIAECCGCYRVRAPDLSAFDEDLENE